MATQTKSPLKSSPLRVAGQSLSEALIDNAFDRLLGPLVIACMFATIALLEWINYLLARQPSPWTFTMVALLVCGFAALRVRHGWRMAARMQLGRSGERAVAQYLEWFRTKGFFVFHDIPTGDANIDHVLIGTQGIYVIETKTLSKPVRGECRITVGPDCVKANGVPLDRDPTVQAKAQAGWLRNFLLESKFVAVVQPVVVIPGWFVERFDSRNVGAWVIEPKALDGFIAKQGNVLALEETKAMASALSSYIRLQSPAPS